MENIIPIEEKLEQMSHEGISKRKKTPVFGTILIVVGISLCILGTQPMQAPEWLKMLFIIAGIVVFLYAIIRLFIDLHSSQYFHEESRQPIRKHTIYVDPDHRQEIIKIINDKDFQRLSRINKTFSSGVILTIMATFDGAFCMLQGEEYLQNEFIPTTQAVMVDEGEVDNVLFFIKSKIANRK